VPARTRYVRSGDVSLAYQVHGEGPIDLVLVNGFLSNVEVLWEEPGVVRWRERLGEFARLVVFDRRGSGLSDRVARMPPVTEEVADLAAVLDAVGSERAVLFGYGAGSAACVAFAAQFPERTRALVLYAAVTRGERADDMPWLPTPAERDERRRYLLEHWGEGSNIELLAPSSAHDPGLRDWFARLERASISPGQLPEAMRAVGATDVRDLLPRVHVPTLVLHRTGDALFDPRHAHYVAARIPGARLVELPGEDSLPFVGDVDGLVGEIEEFLTGGRREREPERELLTVLFTDVCDSTTHAARLGDRRWREVLGQHDAAVRAELARYGGREVKTVGDGFLAVFAGPPNRAVRAARAIVGATAPLGVTVRVGLHTGECERIGDDVGGMAVHIAARIAALAAPGEVLASGTTYGTVVGAGLRWEDRGARGLRGVPGRWPLFALS
jgi:pimeloyl-ACP methyl ester carboxylesterase